MDLHHMQAASNDECMAEFASFLELVQLDAMKEGMRRAADEVASHWNSGEAMINQREQAARSSHALLKASEQLTIKDL